MNFLICSCEHWILSKLLGSHGQVSAIHSQICSSNERCISAAEKGDGWGNFRRLSETAKHVKRAPNRLPSFTITSRGLSNLLFCFLFFFRNVIGWIRWIGPKHKIRHDETQLRQGKARQDRTGQDKTRQDKTRQDKTRQDKARQGKTSQVKSSQDKQDKTRQNMTRHN